VKRFLDTNILVYAQTEDQRAEKARELIAQGGVISVQVLNEFVNVLRKKLNQSWQDIAAAVNDVEAVLGPARPLTTNLQHAALAIAGRHSLSFFDALVIASAADAGCKMLLTEDMQSGASIAGVQLVNPFES
jgi:predicted nucleic acid-binding protein